MIGIAGGGGPAFDFHEGVHVTRLRRPTVPDPRNPDRPKLGAWTDQLDELLLPYAFISSASSSSSTTESRVTVTTAKSLYLTDVDADVQHGDRVRDQDGVTYDVTNRPSSDPNPWTGWRPIRELALTLVEG